MTRVVFMGTPDFSVPCLKNLHEKFDVVGVYTQPDRPVGRGKKLQAPPVKRLALELGLSVFQPEKLSQEGAFEDLAQLKPDIIAVVAFGQILRKNVLELPPLGCINVHSSLLPRWRGAAPIQRAILSGDAETGVTIQKIVRKLDAGDVLLQETTPISGDDTAQTVHDRLAEMGSRLIVQAVEGQVAGTLEGKAQDESQVTYAEKLDKQMQWLDSSTEAEQLDRQVRALNPWPGTSVRLDDGRRLKIQKVRLHRELSGSQGEIFEKSGLVFLGTSQGCLEIQNMQWEGKKPISQDQFLNGLKGSGKTLPFKVQKEEVA